VIYNQPPVDVAIDQGDLIDRCPVVRLKAVPTGSDALEPVALYWRRIVVLTQTCDLANVKTVDVNVAEVFDAQLLVDQGILKPSDIRGPIRGGRVWGWYFLPADSQLGLPEMIVDLRRLHTIQIDLLRPLIQAGERRARLQPLYREHLAKHFADSFSRIGLPRPYETM
jgi:hypothetical protein